MTATSAIEGLIKELEGSESPAQRFLARYIRVEYKPLIEAEKQGEYERGYAAGKSDGYKEKVNGIIEGQENATKGAVKTALERVKVEMMKNPAYIDQDSNAWDDAWSKDNVLWVIDAAIREAGRSESSRENQKCWFSGCEETQDVKEFDSHEEGYVWLCKKHTDLNIKNKTGVPVNRESSREEANKK